MRRNSGDIGMRDEDGVVAGEPGDAHVVVVEKKTNKKEKKSKNKKNDRPVEPEKSPSMKVKNQAWMYQDPCRRPTRFVMVGNCRVYKEQKDLYATYCQARPSSGPKQLCHMCILEGNYFENTFRPNAMLKHCSEKHAAGLECTNSDCRVRMYTEEERLLHVHFCHILPEGWWDWKEYKALDK